MAKYDKHLFEWTDDEIDMSIWDDDEDDGELGSYFTDDEEDYIKKFDINKPYDENEDLDSILYAQYDDEDEQEAAIQYVMHRKKQRAEMEKKKWKEANKENSIWDDDTPSNTWDDYLKDTKNSKEYSDKPMPGDYADDEEYEKQLTIYYNRKREEEKELTPLDNIDLSIFDDDIYYTYEYNEDDDGPQEPEDSYDQDEPVPPVEPVAPKEKESKYSWRTAWDGYEEHVDDEIEKKPEEEKKNKDSKEDEPFWKRKSWADPAKKVNSSTKSLATFQKNYENGRLLMRDFKDPACNKLFAKVVTGVSVSQDGKYVTGWFEFMDSSMEEREFGTSIVVTKSNMSEVLNCMIIIMEGVDNEKVGQMYANNAIADLMEFYINNCLEREDAERKRTIMNIISALRKIDLKNLNQIKNFVKWYNDKRLDWAMMYYKDPDDKSRPKKNAKGMKLMNKYHMGMKRFREAFGDTYAQTMVNICSSIDYDVDKAIDYKPSKKWKDRSLLTYMYVAGLIAMQCECPESIKDIKDEVFWMIGAKAIKAGATIDDIEDVYYSCVN